MSGPFKNSLAGDALAKTVMPAAAIAKAMAPAPKKPAPLPTMEQHADELHPVNITPNRVTGEYSK